MPIANILCVIVYLWEQLLQPWEKLVVLKITLSLIYFFIIPSFVKREQLKGIIQEHLFSSISMLLRKVSSKPQDADTVIHNKVYCVCFSRP